MALQTGSIRESIGMVLLDLPAGLSCLPVFPAPAEVRLRRIAIGAIELNRANCSLRVPVENRELALFSNWSETGNDFPRCMDHQIVSTNRISG